MRSIRHQSWTGDGKALELIIVQTIYFIVMSSKSEQKKRLISTMAARVTERSQLDKHVKVVLKNVERSRTAAVIVTVLSTR